MTFKIDVCLTSIKRRSKMNKELAAKLLAMKDVYLTSEGKKALEELVKSQKDVTSK